MRWLARLAAWLRDENPDVDERARDILQFHQRTADVPEPTRDRDRPPD